MLRALLPDTRLHEMTKSPYFRLTNHLGTDTVRHEPSLAYSLLQLLWNTPVHLNPTAHHKKELQCLHVI
jgi:hypothetical protein